MKLVTLKFKKKDYINLLCVVFSAFIYAINMNTFVFSANLFPAGFAGIARLTSKLLSLIHINISFSILFLVMNIVITIFVFAAIGKKFAIYSMLWFTLASLFTSVAPILKLTDDAILNALFGGVINGLAVGIVLKNNGSSGGTDFTAIYLSMKKNKPMWNDIMILNGIILVIAGIFFGLEQALYSLIFQYASTQVINVIHDRYKLSNLFIITDKTEEVVKAFYGACHHGLTKINAEGEHTRQPKSLLFSTISSYELQTVIKAIKEADPNVFVTINKTEKIVGRYYQTPFE